MLIFVNVNKNYDFFDSKDIVLVINMCSVYK